MKMLALLLLSGIIAAGCASSEKNGESQPDLENLIELTPPEQQNRKDSQVYVDSVQVINYKGSKALLVSGSFPDGCTHLEQASHDWKSGKLELTLSAWRDPDMMCTQALTPFSFIYDEISEQEIIKQSSVAVNGTTYELDQQ